MHAEHKDASARLVQSHAPNEVQAPKHAALHAEIDDDHVGTVATEKPVAGGHVACLQHGIDAGVFQHAPQPLQHDGMVVNDQNARHTGLSSYEKILWRSCTRRDPSFAATARAFSNIIHVASFASSTFMRCQEPDRAPAQCPLRRSLRCGPLARGAAAYSEASSSADRWGGHDGCSLCCLTLRVAKIVAKKSR